jgi:hypothetical protein
MRKTKGNMGLLDKSRFAGLERERIRRLRSLSWKKAIRLEEKMLSSELIWEWRKNFPENHPICLKKSLERMRRNAMRRRCYAALKKGANQ